MLVYTNVTTVMTLYFKTTLSTECGLILGMVLKWNDIYIENIRMVLLIAGLIMEGRS